MRTLSVASLLACLCSLFTLFTLTSAAGSVLSIDYGVDSFKASLIRPGVPFDVLLNRDSKRKTPSSVTLRGEDRHVGGDSVTLSTRFPRDSVAGVKLLLGNNEEQLALHRELYTNTLNVTSRGSNAIAFSHGTNYTVEEVLAMQLAHVKEMAATASSGEKPSDVIVTVPAYFDQVERQAVLDAIDLAGLKPLSLLNDGTAVAVNYALSRTFTDGNETHLFYDAGASSIRATLASFASVAVPDWPGAKTTHNATQIDILGVGWDRTAGGYTFDSRLRDLLRADFAQGSGKKLKVPVQENERAMAKLLKEAARVKQILSANSEAQARIENLAEDIDFRAIVTRDQLDAVCADLSGRLSQPINEALAMANLTVDAVTSVVLVGGHSRVPAVQNAVKSIVPESKIAQNVNADEAAVMGAALYGAIASRSFRTKDIRVRDIFPHAITLAHNATLQGIEPATDETPYILFPARSALGSSQNLSFVSKDNISLSLSSSPSAVDALLRAPIVSANITGIDVAHVNLTDETAALARIDIIVELGEDGILRLSKPRLVVPAVAAKAPSAAGRILGGLFGSKTPENATEETDEGASGNETDTSATPKPPAPVPLGLSVESSQSRGLNKTEKIEAKRRLRDIEQAESRKRAREEARNGLESYLYRLRDQLEETDFTGASTDTERSSIGRMLSEAMDWLSEEGEQAVTKDLRSKRTDLEKLVKPIKVRVEEAKSRDEALSDFSIAIIKAQAFYISANANASEAIESGEPARHTPEEIDVLRKLLEDEQAWMKDLQAAQEKLKPFEDPILRRSELERRAKEVTAQVMKLARKPKPRKPKSATITVDTTSAATTEEATPAATPSVEPSEGGQSEEPSHPTEATPPRHEEL